MRRTSFTNSRRCSAGWRPERVGSGRHLLLRPSPGVGLVILDRAHRHFCRDLAGVIADGPWQRAAMAAHLQPGLAATPEQRWSGPLLQRLFRRFPSDRRPWRHAVRDFLLADANLGRRSRLGRLTFRAEACRPCMWPAPGLPSSELPPLLDGPDCCRLLGLDSPAQLRWLADRWREHDRPLPDHLQVYHQQILPRRRRAPRIIEAPSAALKHCQRQILDCILAKLPIHPAAQGFVPGRDIRSNARIHAGARRLLHLDLEDFFPAIAGRRVAHLFRAFGYPHEVATTLTGLTTTTLPEASWQACGLDPSRHWQRRLRYRQPHLPQGAPTSPAIANLICFRLDCRLAGLAAAHGLRYSRYADDIAFSTAADTVDLHPIARFAAAICEAEGLPVNHRKTRIRSTAAQQRLTGVVINDGVNIDRRSYDRLKATLHRHSRNPVDLPAGEAAQLREHLRGRIAHVRFLRPQRAERLDRLFAAIAWPDETGGRLGAS